jgi:hypothetical protein
VTEDAGEAHSEEVARRYSLDLRADIPLGMRVELPGPCPGCRQYRITADLVRDEGNNLTIWFTWESREDAEGAKVKEEPGI